MNSDARERSHTLTLIVIGTRWGTLSFQVLRRTAAAAACVALVCMILAIYGFVRMTESGGKPSVDTLLKTQKDIKSALLQQQMDNATLREKLRRLENQYISIGQRPPRDEIPASTPVYSGDQSKQSWEITIDKFKMVYREGGYHFQFTLKTAEEKKGKTTGYIFILLPPDRSYPAATIRNGKPINVKEGDHFAILRQKIIAGVITKVVDPKAYERAELVIYSEEGALIFHKAYLLKDL